MFPILERKEQPHKLKGIESKILPVSVDRGEGGAPAKIKFSDGDISIGSCIRCFRPPCIYYEPEIIQSHSFLQFPSDQNREVCPSSAISWPALSSSPVVNSENCMLCGICVMRCPANAIYLEENGAIINDIPNKHFKDLEIVSTQNRTDEIIGKFKHIKQSGVIFTENDKIIKRFRKKFENVAREQNSQFPNHLARNLLINIGLGAAMRRRGDTNIRMDLVLGPPGVKVGIAEVEFSDAIVDAPRSMLDSIAVLVSRYSMIINDIVPIIICLDLPNQRSEYWRLISDINKTLRIQIGTLTIGAAIILGWNRVGLTLKSSQPIYLDAENPDLRPKIEKILGRKIILKGSGYPGFLKSEK